MDSKLAGIRRSGQRPAGVGIRVPGQSRGGFGGLPAGQYAGRRTESSAGTPQRGVRGSSPGAAQRGVRGSSPGAAQRGVRGSNPEPVWPAQARPGGAVAAPRAPFVLLILGLLAGGLVCLLVINTTLDASSFRISQLQQSNSTLAQQEQTLQREVSAAEAPAQIEQLAFQLGMRPVTEMHFLDVGEGTRQGHAGSPLPSRTTALGGGGLSRVKGAEGKRGHGGSAR
jgi:hypothetical protein